MGPGKRERGKNKPTWRSGYDAGRTAMLRPSLPIVDAILATSERAGKPDSTRRDATRRDADATRCDATLIYHASTYDVDGSRTLRDKTDRQQLAVAVRELSRDRTHHVVYAPFLSLFLSCVILPERQIKLG